MSHDSDTAAPKPAQPTDSHDPATVGLTEAEVRAGWRWITGGGGDYRLLYAPGETADRFSGVAYANGAWRAADAAFRDTASLPTLHAAQLAAVAALRDAGALGVDEAQRARNVAAVVGTDFDTPPLPRSPDPMPGAVPSAATQIDTMAEIPDDDGHVPGVLTPENATRYAQHLHDFRAGNCSCGESAPYGAPTPANPESERERALALIEIEERYGPIVSGGPPPGVDRGFPRERAARAIGVDPADITLRWDEPLLRSIEVYVSGGFTRGLGASEIVALVAEGIRPTADGWRWDAAVGPDAAERVPCPLCAGDPEPGNCDLCEGRRTLKRTTLARLFPATTRPAAADPLAALEARLTERLAAEEERHRQSIGSNNDFRRAGRIEQSREVLGWIADLRKAGA